MRDFLEWMSMIAFVFSLMAFMAVSIIAIGIAFGAGFGFVASGFCWASGLC